MSRDFKPIELYLADLDTHEKTGEWIHETKWTFHPYEKEEKVQVERFAKKIDEILYDYDYYGYQDALTGSREDNAEDIKEMLWNCNEKVEDILKHLKDIREEIYEEMNDMVGDCVPVEEGGTGGHITHTEKNHLDECSDLMEKIDDVSNSVEKYVRNHRLWNNEARTEFPKLSFLLDNFETGLFPKLSKSDDDVKWAFWKEVEKALDIETKIVYASYSEEDKVPLYEAERKALRDGNPLLAQISEATETFFKGKYADHFYDARDNSYAFKRTLEKIYEEYEKEYYKAEIESTLAPTDKRNVSIEQDKRD